MAQDSSARPSNLGDDGDPGDCPCDFALRPWHAEMLGLEHDGTTVGWALGCFEEEMGWEPDELVAFVHQHNWDDPASMDDLAERIRFLAGRLGPAADQRHERPSRTELGSVVVQVHVIANGNVVT